MEAFKVGVALAMTSNTSDVLRVVSADLLGVHAKVTALQENFNKLATIIGGALAVGAGVGLLKVMTDIVEKAGELQRVMNNMQLGGMSSGDVAKAMDKAWALTQKYRTLGAARIGEMINEVRSVFGDTDTAVAHIEPALQAATVLKSQLRGRGGDQIVDQVFRMFKTADLRNTTDSPEETRALFDNMTKVITATGGKITPSDFLQMTKYGKTAAQSWSDEFVTRVAASIMQEGSPSTVGTALTSLDQAVVGGKMTNKAARAFSDLGLVASKDIVSDDFRNVTGVQAGSVVGSGLFRKDPYQWIQQVLKTHLIAAGHDTLEKQIPMLAQMFGNRNAEWIANTLLKDRPIERDRQLIGQAHGLSGHGTVLDKDLGTALEGFKTAILNIKQAVGSPHVQTAVNILNRMSDALNRMAQWAVLKENIPVVEALGKGIVVLGGALVAGGAVAILGALGTAGWIAAGLTALGAAVVAFQTYWDDIEKWFASLFQGIGAQKDRLVAFMGEWIKAFQDWLAAVTAQWEALKQAWYAAIGGFFTSLTTEIASWPERLKAVVAEMGNAILQAFKDVFSSIGSLFHKSSAEGGFGFGEGGMLHNASFGGAVGGGPPPTGDMRERGLRIMREMIRGGMTPEAAAVAAGNFEWESHIGKLQGGDGGTAFGLAHWRLDRLEAMKRFVGPNWQSDLEGQARFFMHEARQRGGLQAQMLQMRDMNRINQGMYQYERYRWDGSFVKRLGNAHKWLNLWRTTQGGSGGGAMTPPPANDNPVEVHTAVNMDGRRVGGAVTRQA